MTPTRYRGELATVRGASGRARLLANDPPETERAPQPALDTERAATLRRLVERMLDDESRSPASVDRERRRAPRRPYATPMLLTPLDAGGQPRLGDTVTVVSKDLSAYGIAVVYNRSLSEGAVVLTFRMTDRTPICLLTRVRWRTPMRQGLYVVGGEFVERLGGRR